VFGGCATAPSWLVLVWFILRQCQHDNGYTDGRSEIYVHTDERTEVHSDQSSLVDPSTNQGRHTLTSVNVPLSQPWSPPQAVIERQSQTFNAKPLTLHFRSNVNSKSYHFTVCVRCPECVNKYASNEVHMEIYQKWYTNSDMSSRFTSTIGFHTNLGSSCNTLVCNYSSNMVDKRHEPSYWGRY